MTKAFANSFPAGAPTQQSPTSIELVCPVSTLVQLRAAVDNGADCVQLELAGSSRQGTPEAGINIDAMTNGIRYAHDRQRKVSLRLDTRTQTSSWTYQRNVIDQAAAHGIHAIELSDRALMLYAAAQYPQLELHYSAAEDEIDTRSIKLLRRQFNVSRVALPQVLSMADLICISRETGVELQLYGFSRFSSAITAHKLQAAAKELHMPDRDADTDADRCATSEIAANDNCFSERAAADIKVLRLLPQLNALGIRAIRIETICPRPTHASKAIRIWREAIDECMENIDRYAVRPSWIVELNNAARLLQDNGGHSIPA